MAKLDKQNRLTIPSNIASCAKCDFKDEIRLYCLGENIFLDNPSCDNSSITCFGKVYIDSKNRLLLPLYIQKALRFSKANDILIFLLNDKVHLKKICFENK